MWKPLATHAREAGIPEPSARRYLASFKNWFPTRKAGKGSKALVYGPDTPALLKAISEGFADGKRRAEVEELLAVKFPAMNEVKPIPPEEPSSPAQAPDPNSSPPTLPEVMTALIPLAERFLTAYEAQTKALEAIARALASNRPFKRTDQPGDTNPHPDHETGQEGADIKPVNRDAVIARVMELSAQGLGQHAIMTRIRREGLRMSARGEISKSTVARIIKGDIK